jgi:hypothetical protein
MTNVGSLDRLLRLGLGLALLAAPFVPPSAGWLAGIGAWSYVVMAAGLVLLGTAVFRICPAYLLFGVRTCAADRS